jgi:hypothetical protein
MVNLSREFSDCTESVAGGMTAAKGMSHDKSASETSVGLALMAFKLRNSCGAPNSPARESTVDSIKVFRCNVIQKSCQYDVPIAVTSAERTRNENAVPMADICSRDRTQWKSSEN